MNKNIKGWLWAALAMILVGLALFWGLVFSTDGFSNFATKEEVLEKVYPISESFSNISVDVSSDNVSFLFVPSNDNSAVVYCPERDTLHYSVTVENNTLAVRLVDQRKWYDHISLFTPSSSIQIRLPQEIYGNLMIRGSTSHIEIPKEFSFESVDISVSTGDVYCYASASEGMKIHGSTGSVRVEDVRIGNLDISLSTGCLTLSKVECAEDILLQISTGKTLLKNISANNLTSTGDTGDLTIESGSITNLLSLDRSTGDVEFTDCSMGQGKIHTDTGDVTGTLLSPMIFSATTDTGSVKVPDTTTGGICKITTDTGDIHITLSQ